LPDTLASAPGTAQSGIFGGQCRLGDVRRFSGFSDPHAFAPAHVFFWFLPQIPTARRTRATKLPVRYPVIPAVLPTMLGIGEGVCLVIGAKGHFLSVG